MKRKNILSIVVVAGIVFTTLFSIKNAPVDCICQQTIDAIKQEIQWSIDNPQYVVGVCNSSGTPEELLATEEQWNQMVALGYFGPYAIENHDAKMREVWGDDYYSKNATATASDFNTSANNETTNIVEESACQEAIPETAEPVITVDDSIADTYVATNDIVIVSSYETLNEIDTLTVGEAYTVLGLTSNGYYVVDCEGTEGYIADDDVTLVTVDTYESAWTEAEVEEPTCDSAGYITYYNPYTKETVAEEIEATGHDAGKWVTVENAQYFTDGSEELVCTACNEVLETRVIDSKITPKETIAMAITILAIISLILFLGRKHKNVQQNSSI